MNALNDGHGYFILHAVCTIGIVMDTYGHYTDVAGYLRIQMRSLWRKQPLPVVKVQSHYHSPVRADRYFVSIRNIRIKSYLIRNRPYLCVSVRIYASLSVWLQ